MRHPKARCDCGKVFKFKPKTETINEVDIVYAECTECGKRYLSYVADTEVYERIDNTGLLSAEQQHDYITETRRIMVDKKDEYRSIIAKVIR